MATNTTNFNLSKPAYTDTADIAVINSNMDKVDTSLNGLGSGIAIISKNNTHAAITSGQYVYVHGHGSLAEGLYTAKSNIAANATLSTSNLTAISSGGLNSLYNTLNNKITSASISDYDDFKPLAGNEFALGYSTGANAAHTPYSGDNATFRAIALGNQSYFTQIAIAEYSNAAGNRTRTFIRNNLGGVFTSWKEFERSYPWETIANGDQPITLTIGLYSRALITISGYNTGVPAMGHIVRYHNNYMRTTWFGEAPTKVSITMSSDGNGTVTVANNDPSAPIYVRIEPVGESTVIFN